MNKLSLDALTTNFHSIPVPKSTEHKRQRLLSTTTRIVDLSMYDNLSYRLTMSFFKESQHHLEMTAETSQQSGIEPIEKRSNLKKQYRKKMSIDPRSNVTNKSALLLSSKNLDTSSTKPAAFSSTESLSTSPLSKTMDTSATKPAALSSTESLSISPLSKATAIFSSATSSNKTSALSSRRNQDNVNGNKSAANIKQMERVKAALIQLPFMRNGFSHGGISYYYTCALDTVLTIIMLSATFFKFEISNSVAKILTVLRNGDTNYGRYLALPSNCTTPNLYNTLHYFRETFVELFQYNSIVVKQCDNPRCVSKINKREVQLSEAFINHKMIEEKTFSEDVISSFCPKNVGI
jgi:hypothetical protein